MTTEYRVRQVSDKIHVRYFKGMPEDWSGSVGSALVVSNSETLALAAVTNVSDNKVRINGTTPAQYLEDLIDPTTLEVTTVLGVDKISVIQKYLDLALGGTVLDDIHMAPGKTVDGIDISTIPAEYARLANPDPQAFVGSIIVAQDLIVGGTLYASNVAPVLGAWTQEILTDDATGSDVQYTLTYTPVDSGSVMVFCNGVYQNRDFYSINGNVITFNSAPLAGWNVCVAYVRNVI